MDVFSRQGLKTTAENLAPLNRMEAEIGERRAAHIRESARLLCSGLDLHSFIDGSDELRERYAELVGLNEFNFTSGSIAQNQTRISLLGEKTNFLDKLYLCTFIPELLGFKKSGSLMLSAFGNSEMRKNNIISYLKNAYTDIAYNSFADILYSPSVTYSEDFNGVCEDVYYGKTDYAILPLESSNDGRLSRFRNLMEKYDLKVSATCNVVSNSDGGRTKFGLLSKNIEIITTRKDEERYFEFILPSGLDKLPDVLMAAKYFGISILKTDSVPLSYTDSEFSCDVVLNITHGQADYLICYLLLEAPEFIPLGIYPHLNT